MASSPRALEQQIDEEVELLKDLMEKGKISEDQVEDYLNDNFDVDQFLEAQLEEQRLLNAKLKAMEADQQYDVEEESMNTLLSSSSSIHKKSRDKPIVMKKVVQGATRRQSQHSQPMLTQQEISENRRIQEGNMHLLRRLQRIQQKGGETATFQQPRIKHESSSHRNRKDKSRIVAHQNLQLLKRLQSVKSTVSGARGAPRGVTRVPRDSRVSREPRVSHSKRVKQRPAWVDVPGCGL